MAAEADKEEAGAAPRQVATPWRSAAERVAAAAWSGRGFFGGLAAIALALLGQATLLAGGAPSSALFYYLAAVALLVASLYRRSISASAPARDRLLSGRQFPPAVVRAPSAATLAWRRWAGWRERLDPRVTLTGIGTSIVLAALSAGVLAGNTGSLFGGWLWASALLLLLLSLAGAGGPSREETLLPGPQSDFFAPGLPGVSRSLETGLVAAVLLLAAGLRIYNLEYLPGIFGDEGERGVEALRILNGSHDNLFGYGLWAVPNLYYYILSFMLRVFGTNMVGDRMLSVASGLLAVWYVYRIGRLLWGVRAGLLAGAMLAVSPLALQFSRLAGESTPTGALWAIGFFYLCLALRNRRWSDWALAGTAWGFSLYFYAAGKLIIPLFGLTCLYCLLRWRRDFFKRYALGFLLAVLAFTLTFMPYAIFSVQDNWHGFTGRAQETSILSPQNQPQAFGMYGIPYDPGLAGKPLVSNLLGQPASWALLIFNQIRTTTEVIYRSGDPTLFYQIHEHGGSMLAPLWAALALLGLAYAAWKAWDARFGLVGLWFWVGMLGAALTIDTPSVQRLAGAWPAIMLFPAVVLDRVFAAAWPLSLSAARRWAAVPLVALMLFFGIDSYREYFVHYRSLCPYCASTVQARYVQALGQQYKAYELGIGDDLVSFNYGSTRFVAGDVEGVDLPAPGDYLPLTDNAGKGAAFLVYPENVAYLPLIRLFYPGGAQEEIKGSDGSVRFTSYKLAADQLAGFQVLRAVYTGGDGRVITREEPNLGTSPAGSLPGRAGTAWSAPLGLTYPARVEWEGGLVAPSYGTYTFSLAGADGAGNATLGLDGRVIVDESLSEHLSKTGWHSTEVVLAKGLHEVRLTAKLLDATGRVEVGWAADSGAGEAGSGVVQTYPVEARYLYKGITGGLSGEIGPRSDPTALRSSDPFAGHSVTSRRSDPFLGFQEATVALGSTPFIARWRGKLTVPKAGGYTFETISNGPSLLMVDGRVAVDNRADGVVGSASASATLAAGDHNLEVRYAWASGPARLSLYWTPPGGQRELIPPTALVPAARIWTPEEQPGAPRADAGPPPLTSMALQAVIGSDAGLSRPRGVGVDGDGNIYVGDRGNHRVVVFSPGGKVLRTWGKALTAGSGTATPANPAESQPGEFEDISDLDVSADGKVYVMDYGAQRLQVFDTQGRVLKVVGKAVLGTCGANGIGAAPGGTLYMACTSTSVVRTLLLSADGEEPRLTGTAAGGEPGQTGGPDQPVDAASDSSGRQYVIDLENRLVRFGPGVDISARWSVPVGAADGGGRLALSPDGTRAYVTDPDRQRVEIVDLSGDGGAVAYFGAPGTGPGQFQGPSGVAVGRDGRVYVLDGPNGNVQVFEPAK